MGTTGFHDPMSLLMMGFVLAMGLVVIVLLLARRYASTGYTPAQMSVPVQDPGSRINAGCLIIPLLVTAIVIVLSLIA